MASKLPQIQKMASKFPQTQKMASKLPQSQKMASELPQSQTMDSKLPQPKNRDNSLSALNVAIDAFILARILSDIPAAQAVFGTLSVVLTMVRDSLANELDYIDLVLACADVCAVLDRGLKGKRSDELSQSVLGAIEQLRIAISGIEAKIIRLNNRGPVSRLFHAKHDKAKIADIKFNLFRILDLFNTELAIEAHVEVFDIRRNAAKTHNVVSTTQTIVSKTHNIVSDIRHTLSRHQGGSDDRNSSIRIPGEYPPPTPRVCFGRDGLIEKIICLAENLKPLALIGPGGVGKTSVALTVLHHDRIKQRFGDNRRFIRCDQFPASSAHFLARLSKVIGAGVENPEDLAPLRPSLSSKEILIVLDNADSILDPQGANGQEIYEVVEELSQFSNVCLCITSRITTIPPDCKRLDVPTLSTDAARSTFYHIYDSDHRPDLIDTILEQLDFHPLSVTLLATVAHQNNWDSRRLVKEWKQRQMGVLRTQHNRSLATTIELSLTSPTFQELGPDARELLGVVAFLPQGVDEKKIGWIFPTVSNRKIIFDKFCILSLTHRRDGFITMLAPLRDYLRPNDPAASPLLCTAKDNYFARLSVKLRPNGPEFNDARWIVSEDLNVEHLLDVFTSINANSEYVWDTCAKFMNHLYWHKPRQTILGTKAEELPDHHRFKPKCLFELSGLADMVGNQTERKRLLTYALKLWRQRGDVRRVSSTLLDLSDANRLLNLHAEGIRQAKEALKIYEQINDVSGQATCFDTLAWLVLEVKQLDAAEEYTLRAIDLLPEKGNEFLVRKCHRTLGMIYQSKQKRDKAIRHFKVALGVGSASGRRELFWIYFSLAQLFSDEGEFDNADSHIEQAKSQAANDPYLTGRAMHLHAKIWYRQRMFEDATLEALRACEIYQKLGAAKDLESCKALLRNIKKNYTADLSPLAESDFIALPSNPSTNTLTNL